jgi:hypothetical protein
VLVGVLPLLLGSCLGTLAAADSHPTQIDCGLTATQYGDAVVAGPKSCDTGDQDRGQSEPGKLRRRTRK